jgi:hypothetical protein
VVRFGASLRRGYSRIISFIDHAARIRRILLQHGERTVLTRDPSKWDLSDAGPG